MILKYHREDGLLMLKKDDKGHWYQFWYSRDHAQFKLWFRDANVSQMRMWRRHGRLVLD